MIIKTSTGSTIYVTNEQGEIIKEAIRRGVEYIDINDMMLKTSAIMSIEKSSPQGHIKPAETLALSAPVTDLSDDERKHNLSRIQQLKAQLSTRRKII